MEIDINCDVGEGYDDALLLPYLTSCNIACGVHAGDEETMERTVRLAMKHGVVIGAHPAYPDREGFGRRKMDLAPAELRDTIVDQVTTLKGIAECLGAKVSYVKPHGALYNRMAEDMNEARHAISAIQRIDPSLLLMGLAHSVLEQLAEREGMRFIAEGFADRRYDANGKLISRKIEGALITDPDQVVAQVLSMIVDKRVKRADGRFKEIEVQSICVHGDNPAAVDILRAIDLALQTHGIAIKSFAA